MKSKNGENGAIAPFFVLNWTSMITTIKSALEFESLDDLFQLSRSDTIEERIVDIISNLIHAYEFVYIINKDTKEVACFATISKYGVYENLYVFKKYRRNGYAKQMDELILHTAAKLGFLIVYTTVRSDNINIGKRLEEWTTHKITHVRNNLYLISYKKNIFNILNIIAILKRFIYK